MIIMLITKVIAPLYSLRSSIAAVSSQCAAILTNVERKSDFYLLNLAHRYICRGPCEIYTARRVITERSDIRPIMRGCGVESPLTVLLVFQYLQTDVNIVDCGQDEIHFPYDVTHNIRRKRG